MPKTAWVGGYYPGKPRCSVAVLVRVLRERGPLTVEQLRQFVRGRHACIVWACRRGVQDGVLRETFDGDRKYAFRSLRVRALADR